MSAEEVTAHAPAQDALNDLSLKGALKSEVVKFRGLRSLVWLTVAGAVAQAALGPIQVVGLVAEGGQDGSVSGLDAALSLALAGMGTACILFGIAGVLTVTSEFPSKAIRGTFMAVPRRSYIVVAKLLAYTLIAGTVAALASAIAVLGAMPGLRAIGYEVDPRQLDVPRVVVGAALYLVLWGVYGQLLGWLIRSTIGATMALLAFFFVLTGVTALLPDDVAEAVHPLLPSQTSAAMLNIESVAGSVSPALGGVLSFTYVVIGAAWITRRVTRRDA